MTNNLAKNAPYSILILSLIYYALKSIATKVLDPRKTSRKMSVILHCTPSAVRSVTICIPPLAL